MTTLDLTAAVEAAKLALSDRWHTNPADRTDTSGITNMAVIAIEAALPHLLVQIREGIAAEIMAEGTRRSHWGTIQGITAFTATNQDAEIALNYGKEK